MEPLINFVLSIIDKFYVAFVVQPDELAARVRLGRWVRAFGPGLHVRLPFGIDEVYIETAVIRSDDLAEISIETTDDVPMLCSVALRYEVVDVVTALVGTEDYADSLMTDVTGLVSAWVNSTTYADLSIESLIKGCQPAIKRMASRWGCRVHELLVNTLVKHRAYRLIT